MIPAGFTAVVLAADRNTEDPLVKSSGACCKALIEFQGTPMLERVTSALADSAQIDNIILSGPRRECLATNPSLQDQVDNGRIQWLEPQSSPSTSAYQAMQSLSAETPVLITSADQPLLRTEIVDYFLQQAQTTGADVVVALASFKSIQAKYPDAKKTVLRFSDGGHCGCNMFAFMTPRSRRVADAWRKVEQQRKNPLRVISQLGWWSVIRYLLGRLTLDTALKELSARFEVDICAVILPFPEAAIDVDSAEDQKLVADITGTDT